MTIRPCGTFSSPLLGSVQKGRLGRTENGSHVTWGNSVTTRVSPEHSGQHIAREDRPEMPGCEQAVPWALCNRTAAFVTVFRGLALGGGTARCNLPILSGCHKSSPSKAPWRCSVRPRKLKLCGKTSSQKVKKMNRTTTLDYIQMLKSIWIRLRHMDQITKQEVLTLHPKKSRT